MEDSLVRLLAGDDLRSTGRVEEVIQLVRQDPARIEELVRGLEAEEVVVRMRAADALEKITAGDHALLQPYKTQLLEVARTAGQQEVRWHLALMLPRLRLTRQERDAALELLRRYLEDRSLIVQVMSLQALADFAAADESLWPEVVALLESRLEGNSPAVRARSRKLLAGLRTGKKYK